MGAGASRPSTADQRAVEVRAVMLIQRLAHRWVEKRRGVDPRVLAIKLAKKNKAQAAEEAAWLEVERRENASVILQNKARQRQAKQEVAQRRAMAAEEERKLKHQQQHKAAMSIQCKMRQRAAQAETADLLSMRHLATVNSDELCLACMAGDALLAEQLVEEGGALVNWTDRDGMTPLHHAASGGYLEVAKLMVDKFGADVNAIDRGARSPLGIASDPLSPGWAFSPGDPRSDFNGLASWLDLERGAKLTQEEADRRLFKALNEADLQGCVSSIAQGADVDGAWLGERLQGAYHRPLKRADGADETAVTAAFLYPKDRVTPMSQMFGSHGPLHLAAFRGLGEIANLLLANKADPNLSTAELFGETPLHVCAFRGALSPLRALLADARTSCDARDMGGDAPLHCAAREGRAEAVLLLLQGGDTAHLLDRRLGSKAAEKKEPEDEGGEEDEELRLGDDDEPYTRAEFLDFYDGSAVEWEAAPRYHPQSKAGAKAGAKGAEPSPVGHRARTPLGVARSGALKARLRGEAALERILTGAAKASVADPAGELEGISNRPYKVSGSRPDARGWKDFSPPGQHTRCVEILEAWGASISQEEADEFLFQGADLGDLKLCRTSVEKDGANVDALRPVVDATAHEKAVKSDGWRPLHAAAAKNRVAIIDYLLYKGANKDLSDVQGRTPRALAELGGHEEAGRRLRDPYDPDKNRAPPRMPEPFGRGGAGGAYGFDLRADVIASLDQALEPELVEPPDDETPDARKARLAAAAEARQARLELEKLWVRSPAAKAEAEKKAKERREVRQAAMLTAAKLGDVDLVKGLLGVPVGVDDDEAAQVPKGVPKQGARFGILAGEDLCNCKAPMFGEAPLHLAAAKSQAKTVALLVKAGAYIESRDRSGWSPLHYAALLGDAQVVGALLSHGADKGAKNADGRRPYDVAKKARRPKALRKLLEVHKEKHLAHRTERKREKNRL